MDGGSNVPIVGSKRVLLRMSLELAGCHHRGRTVGLRHRIIATVVDTQRHDGGKGEEEGEADGLRLGVLLDRISLHLALRGRVLADRGRAY